MALVFRVPVEREVEEEVEFHLRMRIQEYVAAGMSHEEARAQALARLGDLDHLKADLRRLGEEREGRMRRTMWWDDVRQDVRLALRQMLRAPGFALAATLTLALAIGANTAVFSVLNGVLLRPLPYEEPGELVAVWTRYLPSSGLDIAKFPLSGPEFLDYREQSRALAAVAAWGSGSAALTGDGADPERVATVGAGRGLFELLGVRPALGRSFVPEDAEGGGTVVVLSHALWARRFGSDPGVVGRSIELNGAPRQVIGVMPEGFVFPTADTELWTPLQFDEADPGNRAGHGLGAVARLAEGIGLEQAETELETITAGWNEQYQHHAMGHFLFLTPLAEDLVGDARSVLLLLAGAVGLVLLIACGNVANLFLTRAETRHAEMAVRRALGAGRGRLVRQLVVEGLVVSSAGGLAGLALAWLALPAVLAIDPTAIPRSEGVGLDGNVLLFTGALVVLTTLAFGSVPALSRAPVTAGGRGATSGRGTSLRRALVGGEVALGLVVVLAAGLVSRSLMELEAVDPGLRSQGLVTFGLAPAAASYPDPERVQLFYDQLLERVGSLPGVEGAGVVSTLPLVGKAGVSDFLPEGEPPPAEGVPQWSAQFLAARPEYFRVAGIPVIEGRLPDRNDHAESFPVAVVNEALLRRYFPGEAMVGRRIAFNWSDSLWITVVGVVGDTRHDPKEPPEPAIYINHAQLAAVNMGTGRSMSVVVRTPGDPETLLPSVRGAVAELDPSLPISNPRTFEEVADRSVARPRLTARLLVAFAGLALLLAVVGIWGVVSYATARRGREIALRMALGARRERVTGMVVAEGARPVVLGLVVGLGFALWGSRLLASQLFGVSATDPLTFAAVPAGLLVVALLATWLPARRATRVEPSAALRDE